MTTTIDSEKRDLKSQLEIANKEIEDLKTRLNKAHSQIRDLREQRERLRDDNKYLSLQGEIAEKEIENLKTQKGMAFSHDTDTLESASRRTLLNQREEKTMRWFKWNERIYNLDQIKAFEVKPVSETEFEEVLGVYSFPLTSDSDDNETVSFGAYDTFEEAVEVITKILRGDHDHDVSMEPTNYQLGV